LPSDLATVTASESPIGIVKLIVECGFASSNGEARRLADQGAVTFAGEKVADAKTKITIDGEAILKVGKRRICKVMY